MDKDQLRRAVAALREELDTLEVESEEKANLEGLVHDIERHLDPEDEDPDLSERIEHLPRLVERFELEYPRLTRTLNEIMITLSNMGI